MSKEDKLRIIQRLFNWDSDKMRYNKKLIDDLISDDSDNPKLINLDDYFTEPPYTKGTDLYPIVKKQVMDNSDCYYLLLKYKTLSDASIDTIQILNATQSTLAGVSCNYIYPGSNYFPHGVINSFSKITGDGSTLTSEILLYYETEYPIRQILNIIPENSVQLIATNLE